MLKKEYIQTSKYLSLLTQIGLMMVINIVAFLFAGIFLDRWLNTGGLLTVIFLLLGIGSGFYNVYKIITEVMSL
ncbi:AtpZ/AtpI family protein [Candidatus Margulisiibacteriota bacterium]